MQSLKALTLIKKKTYLYRRLIERLFHCANIPEISLTVETNTLISLSAAHQRECRFQFCGGEDNSRGNCGGDFTIDMIRRLRFDCAFVTSACISARFGLSIQLGFWPGILNAIIDSSKKTVGLYPTEKIGFESIRKICEANRLDTLITEWTRRRKTLRYSTTGIESSLPWMRNNSPPSAYAISNFV